MFVLLTRPGVVSLSDKALLQKEANLIKTALDEGVDRIHIRKPAAELQDIEALLSQLPAPYLNQVMLHPPKRLFSFLDAGDQYSALKIEALLHEGLDDLFSWMQQRGLRGLHLPQWLRLRLSSPHKQLLVEMAASSINTHGFYYTTGVHDKNALDSLLSETDQVRYAYVFISPLFDSISKKGYAANPSLLGLAQQVLRAAKIQTKLIGLGGINAHNIGEVKKAGFGGVALMGALWTVPISQLASLGRPEFINNINTCVRRWKA